MASPKIMSRIEQSMPPLIAALRGTKMSQLGIDTLIQLTFFGGYPTHYHIPTLQMLATTFAMSRQAVQNTLASGKDLGQDKVKELEETGAIYARIESFLYDKIDSEKEKENEKKSSTDGSLDSEIAGSSDSPAVITPSDTTASDSPSDFTPSEFSASESEMINDETSTDGFTGEDTEVEDAEEED